MQEYLEIGRIVNTFGIKGMVKVDPYTEDITRFEKLKTIYIIENTKKTEMKIEEVKYHKNMVLLKFKGINDINTAEKYKGKFLKIHRKDAIELPKDTYFIADIIGSKVTNHKGKHLGIVKEIFSTGSNDVYVVKDKSGKEILIPSLKDVILDIDIENQIVNVHWEDILD